MKIDLRAAAVFGVATVLACALASPAVFPAAFANEPQSHLLDTATDIFPPKFDASTLRKFDINFDDSVSTEVTKRQTVTKYAFGHRSVVGIVTTPSGTYSTDGLASPNVRYPGIEVSRNDDAPCTCRWGNHFTFGTMSTPRGTGTFMSRTTGSFTYFNYSFKPAYGTRL